MTQAADVRQCCCLGLSCLVLTAHCGGTHNDRPVGREVDQGDASANLALDAALPGEASFAEAFAQSPDEDGPSADGPGKACGPPVEAMLQPSVCSTALCGNGQIDSCVPDFGEAGVATEQCDGQNVGGQTCVSLGFAGGSLACLANCSFDTRGCQSCVTGPRPLACARPDLGGALVDNIYTSLAMAATTEIAVAWAEASASQTPLHFTRFRSDFTPLSDTCLPLDGVHQVALASTSSGWLIAVQKPETISILSLDSAGKLRSSPEIASKPYLRAR